MCVEMELEIIDHLTKDGVPQYAQTSDICRAVLGLHLGSYDHQSDSVAGEKDSKKG